MSSMYNATRNSLKDFDNQHEFERLAADVLNALGFSEVIQSHHAGAVTEAKTSHFTMVKLKELRSSHSTSPSRENLHSIWKNSNPTKGGLHYFVTSISLRSSEYYFLKMRSQKVISLISTTSKD